ncbi:hypothetical protein PHET_11432 [Paragonimus heterotremus]|uniref:Uncharacterized protein n=1 Tax=Paragonimus heterotremus TaxID=100268 RepID=A0A8J4SKZ0_9TREM|nr:hypothetical protein PHET_11432 [Paragonimus heterotremus]
MIVPYYIANVLIRFITLVATRVAIIHSLTSPDQWRHGRLEYNPADSTSRGMHNHTGIESWLSGPAFLKQPDTAWLKTFATVGEPIGVEMKRPSAQMNAIIVNEICVLDARSFELT